jgi:hypothetical protein
MRLANRKAKFGREAGLSALESFANIGETPEDWKRFRLKWPDFFPAVLTEWFYKFAESWDAQFRDYPELKQLLKPPLLFYRDGLRRVWMGRDQKGIFLKLLLGFEQDVKNEIELGRPGLYLPSAFYTPEGKRKAQVEWRYGRNYLELRVHAPTVRVRVDAATLEGDGLSRMPQVLSRGQNEASLLFIGLLR